MRETAVPNPFAQGTAACLVVTTLFVSEGVTGIYAGARIAQPPALAQLCQAAFWVSLWAWFWLYSQARGIRWVMDMGYFVVLIGFVLVPYYIIKSEGRRGWGLIGIFVLLLMGAVGTRVAVAVWLRVLLGEG